MDSHAFVAAFSSTHLYLTPRSTQSLSALGLAPTAKSSDEAISLCCLEYICARAAEQAARLVREMRADLVGKDGRVAARAHKSSEVDPVTAVDEASERFLQHFLLTAMPSSAILGEEEGRVVRADDLQEQGSWNVDSAGAQLARGEQPAPKATADQSVPTDKIVWVVDPIDGTVNFMYGQPDCAVSVAATLDGIPVAAAVAPVTTGDTYHARVGAPATYCSSENRSGTKLQGGCREQARILPGPAPSTLATTLVATGFGYVAEQRASQAQVLLSVLPQVRDIRRAGSAALDLCHLAAGMVDAYYEHGLGPWDYAAGALIAARAGVDVLVPRLKHDKTEKLLVVGAKSEVLPQLVEALDAARAGVTLASK